MTIDLQAIQQAKTAGEAAAMWWASVLRDPKLDNGDDSPMMAVITALSKQHAPAHSTDALERFAEILSDALNYKLDGAEADLYINRYGINLGVDYHPDELLESCASMADLHAGMGDWPWKTGMSVKPDEVIVTYGYGGQPEIVWTKS